MEPLPPLAEDSTFRSADRTRVLVTLSSLGQASIGQLSRITGIQWKRVKAALLGAPPDYAIDRSLVGAGLAREIRKDRGRLFEITARGRRKARSLVARWTRRASTLERFLAAGRLTRQPSRRGEAEDRSPARRAP